MAKMGQEAVRGKVVGLSIGWSVGLDGRVLGAIVPTGVEEAPLGFPLRERGHPAVQLPQRPGLSRRDADEPAPSGTC